MTQNNKYGDIALTGNNLKDEEAVKGAVLNLLMIQKGTCPWQRELGSNLEAFLFEPYLFSTSRLILSDIVSTISKWDKRATVADGTDIEMLVNSQIYRIHIALDIEGFDEIIKFSFDKAAKQKKEDSNP